MVELDALNTTVAAPEDGWAVSYSDPSGNRYRFWKDGEGARFAYDPVTPEQSSSGTYSGGQKKQGALAVAEVDALFHWLRDFEADTAGYASSRMKGTGAFRIREGDQPARLFVIRRGPRLTAFNTFIESYRNS